MKFREKPCLCVSCKCGSIIAAGIYRKDYPIDEEWQNELYEYAEQGYLFSVKNADEFELNKCKC